MGLRNSIIYLAKNIKLDKDYRSVLKYSETEMLNLVTNQSNLVYSSNDYSFIRDTGTIQLKATYSQVCQANYMAFQNKDYSNKWFFAFIDEVIYKGDACTEIRYSIDKWATWFSYWTPQACFVVREHVIDDTFGKNTVPEDLELGDYISTDLQPSFSDLGSMVYVLGLTEMDSSIGSYYTRHNTTIPVGLYYYGFEQLQDAQKVIDRLDGGGQGDKVNCIFVAPRSFFSDWHIHSDYAGKISIESNYEVTSTVTVTHVNYLGNNYVPKNNKLLCFPYSYLQVSNSAGQVINYQWELFHLVDLENPNYEFQVVGTLTPSCSIKAYPINYKNMINDYDDSITFGKLPIGAYTNDLYTNWLTQNGVNIGISLASSTLQVVGGAMMTGTGGGAIAGASGMTSGLIGIAQTLGSIYQHSLIPDSVSGNINCGDINYVMGLYNLMFKRISIKNEYARIIDDYFSRQGYKVNRVKVPNMGRRQNYNYVKIGAEDNVAIANNYNNICPPASDLNEINNLFRRGVTIWNNHSNLGNYSVSNNITNS